VIRAGAGNDMICSGGGSDVVLAGQGDDRVYGAQGWDDLRGEAGIDRLYGGRGNDILRGGDGNDVANGGIGDDLILGGYGRDLLVGHAGTDTLRGEADDDILRGQAGYDDLGGGFGDDRLTPGKGGAAVDGGAGVDDCGPAGGPNCEIVALSSGDTGKAVEVLQERLTTALFYRGPISGEFDRATEYGALGFHKAAVLPRTYDWKYEDWRRLARFTPAPPARTGEPDRVEVDITRQILTLILGGEVAAIVPVSTGSGGTFINDEGRLVRSYTPRGDFRLTHHASGWQCSYIGCIYYPWYFTPSYAIHGFPSVPEYPASHGCVRVPTWESLWLDVRLYVGMPMHVWPG
jgi:lipoprotein-anchoring transpeptidase ErfK/SrfK